MSRRAVTAAMFCFPKISYMFAFLSASPIPAIAVLNWPIISGSARRFPAASVVFMPMALSAFVAFAVGAERFVIMFLKAVPASAPAIE